MENGWYWVREKSSGRIGMGRREKSSYSLDWRVVTEGPRYWPEESMHVSEFENEFEIIERAFAPGESK